MKTCLLCVLLLAGGSISAQTAAELSDKAVDEVQKNNHKLALKYIDQAIALEPEQIDHYLVKATIQAVDGDFEGTFSTFSRAESLDPEYSRTYQERAHILDLLDMNKEALEDYDNAVRYAENDTLLASYLCNRSIPKKKMRDFDGALDDLLASYRIDSTSTATLSNLAMVYDEFGDWELALSYLFKALEINPEMVEACSNVGFIYQNHGEHHKAIEYFDKSLAIDENPYGYNNRAYSKLQLGDLKGALKDIERSLEMYPRNSYAYRNRALVYLAGKKTKKACEDLQKAVELGFTERYGPEVEQLIRENCNW